MTRFGPYDLQGLIGRGGMGEVHRAFHRDHGRLVALKVLRPSMATDPEATERFRRESLTAAQLNDPHVIPIHGHGEIVGRLYIDMRLVEGSDLATLIARSGPLDPERAVSIVAQAAQALDAAHAAGLVHRDVKPSNLLVTPQDFVYLVDFGIARVIGRGSRGAALTVEGAAIGTLDYMAPEQFTGLSSVDARADVYSLACVLYEALTGQRPFPEDSAPALMHAQMHTAVPRVTVLRPDLPAGLDDVVAVGMAKDPADRYATAGGLATAALAALSDPTGESASTNLWSRRPARAAAPTEIPARAAAQPAPMSPRRSTGSGPWVVAAVCVLVVAVLGGILLGRTKLGLAAPATPEPTPIVDPPDTVNPPVPTATPAPTSVSQEAPVPIGPAGVPPSDLDVSVPAIRTGMRERVRRLRLLCHGSRQLPLGSPAPVDPAPRIVLCPDQDELLVSAGPDARWKQHLLGVLRAVPEPGRRLPGTGRRGRRELRQDPGQHQPPTLELSC